MPLLDVVGLGHDRPVMSMGFFAMTCAAKYLAVIQRGSAAQSVRLDMIVLEFARKQLGRALLTTAGAPFPCCHHHGRAEFAAPTHYAALSI